MKKMLIIFVTFLMFSLNVDATPLINSMEINVNIQETGIAEVTETWKIPEQKEGIISKNYYNVEHSSIKEITIVDSQEHPYIEGNNTGYYFNQSKKGNNSFLNIYHDGKETVLTIKYIIDGIISTYEDAEGINWYFLKNNNDMDIKNINVNISNYIDFNENNVGLFCMGNNINCQIKNGQILINSTKRDKNNKIYLLTTFTDIKYLNTIKINDSFNHYYNNNKLSLLNDIKSFAASGSVIIVLIITIIFIMIIVIKSALNKSYNKQFSFIKIKSKVLSITSINDAEIFEYIPNDDEFYRIEFIANLFGITKNRANIIMGIIFKWIINGYASIDIDNKSIMINQDLHFDNPLEQQLYEIIRCSSPDLIIKNNVLSNYFSNNPHEINEWFKQVYSYAIKCEYDEGNIKVSRKYLVVNDKLVNLSNQIIGLKKYLLNYHQTQKDNEPTLDEFKNILICSCILGVSDALQQEILRKDNTNEFALSLHQFELLRDSLLPYYEIKCNLFPHIKKHLRKVKKHNEKENNNSN